MSAPPPRAASISLSTASVYPDSSADAFEMASRLGYDGLEIMVGIDEISQDIRAVEQLVDYHQLPVVAIHAPTLLITQRVWGTEPWAKLHKGVEMVRRVGAEVIVVHPPFRWQRDYARAFVDGIAELEAETGIAFCVENMYPWRAPRRELQAYAPGWDPVEQTYANVTLDLSHTASAHADPLAMARDLGPRLRHVHMTDGTGSAKDEHLVPGRGGQPCGEFLEHLGTVGYAGHVVVEINTRRSESREDRELDLAESLAFIRLHLDTVPSPDGTGGANRASA